MALSGRVLRGAGVLGAAGVLSRLVGAASLLILARLLTPQDFGLVALATALLGVVEVVTELRLHDALIRIRRMTREHLDTVFTLGVARGVLIAVVLPLGGAFLAASYDDPRLLPICAVLAIAPLLTGVQSPAYVRYARDLAFGRVASVEIGVRLVAFAATVAVAVLTRSYWAIVISPVLGAALTTAMTIILAPHRPRLTLSRHRDILGFSVWTNLTQMTSQVAARADSFLIAGALGPVVLGFYEVGSRAAAVIAQGVLDPLQRVLYPAFSHLNEEPERLKAAYLRSQQSLAAIALPVGFGTALIAHPLVALAIGPDWALSATVIAVISPVFAMQLLLGPVRAVALAMGHQRMLFGRSVLIVAIRTPIVVAGLLLYGLPGLLAGRVIVGVGVNLVVNALLARHILGVRLGEQALACRRSVLSVCVMAAAGLLAREAIAAGGEPLMLAAEIACVVAAGAAAYLGAHALLWLAEGRPAGPEAQVLDAARGLLARFRRPGERGESVL